MISSIQLHLSLKLILLMVGLTVRLTVQGKSGKLVNEVVSLNRLSQVLQISYFTGMVVGLLNHSNLN